MIKEPVKVKEIDILIKWPLSIFRLLKKKNILCRDESFLWPLFTVGEFISATFRIIFGLLTWQPPGNLL